MAQPQIIFGYDPGTHNTFLDEARKRLTKLKPYEDQSTICIVPTRGVIPARTVECLANLASPMNQKFVRIFVSGAEVGEAYDEAIKMILAHPDLSTWRYVLTIEEDMLFPADLLLRLLEDIGDYDGIGALYWTKGPEGMPMAFGDPTVQPLNFVPQFIEPNTVREVNGIAQGASLFPMETFRKIDEPRFKTVRSATEAWTQDLFFCHKARLAGCRFAVTTNVLCGHLDAKSNVVW